jgi:ribose transport system substrate-binding protein
MSNNHDHPLIAIFTKNRSNPAYEAARIGAERAATRLGARVEHYVPDIPDDADQQSALVLQALARKPDAFVFTRVHLTKVEPALDLVSAAGIPIFSYVGRMAPGRCITHVGATDFELAFDVANRLFDHLGGNGKITILEGPPSTTTNQDRVRGYLAAAAKRPGIEIIGRCSGWNLRDPGRLAFAELLLQHERIDGVLAANDDMAIGALAALEVAGRKAAVVGVNAIPEAINLIRDGRMVATADFNAMLLCHLATECAIRHLRGEAVPSDVELSATIVDGTNYKNWDFPYSERPLLTLKDIKK